ncbi:unnamed protein product, partial [Durusdinium trenchii]
AEDDDVSRLTMWEHDLEAVKEEAEKRQQRREQEAASRQARIQAAEKAAEAANGTANGTIRLDKVKEGKQKEVLAQNGVLAAKDLGTLGSRPSIFRPSLFSWRPSLCGWTPSLFRPSLFS